jgi:hypothetical protein
LDSELEAKTYELLLELVPENRVICHRPIQVLPESPAFSAWDWKVDFTVLSPDLTNAIYVEVKGIREHSFTNMLKVLAQTSPETFSHLVIVTNKPRQLFGKHKRSVDQLGLAKLITWLEVRNWQPNKD